MPIATTYKDSILSWFKGTAFPSVPAGTYVALLTTNPTADDGTGLVEVSTGTWSNYARISAAFGSISGTGTRSMSNSGTVDYGTSVQSGNVTVIGFAVYSAVTAGTFLGWGTLTSATITNGTAVSFAVGALSMSVQ